MAGLGVATMLGGCPAPGVTENPLNTPEEGPPVVSFCYAPLVTDRRTEILPLAREACTEAAGDAVQPVRWKRNFFLNECPLFKKMRVSYVCRLPDESAKPAAVHD